MKQMLFVFLALLLPACGGVSAGPTVYYVDFDRGNDAALGTSPNAPWRHAPGDALATGKPSAVKLGAGDEVRFKGGVAYRGQVTVNASGSLSQPLIFSGNGYGEGSAIFEGADPVMSVSPCASSLDCGGAANWQHLSNVSFKLPQTSLIKFYDSDGLLFEAQTPTSDDAFFADDVSSYLISPTAAAPVIETGRLRAPELARRLGGKAQGTLLLWVFGNQVERRPVSGIDGDTLLFDPDGIRLYADRPGRYALLGLADSITGPGQYVLTAPDRAIVWQRNGPLMVGHGRGGFDLRNREGITITGFIFRHQTAAAKRNQEGQAINRQGLIGSGLAISKNRFEHSALWDGKGVIAVSNISNALITDNIITLIERGSGMRIGGGTSNLQVTGNRIDSVGRTGIAFLGAADSEISNNVISNLRGIHGNGISLYLANRRIRVVDNFIEGTTRPMTFHGDKSRLAPGDHQFLIERNIFLATPTAQAALTSWGGTTRNVVIRNNVLIAPKGGLMVNGSDTGLIVADNNISGSIIFNRGKGDDWKIENNSSASSGQQFSIEDSVLLKSFCKETRLKAGQTLGGFTCI